MKKLLLKFSILTIIAAGLISSANAQQVTFDFNNSLDDFVSVTTSPDPSPADCDLTVGPAAVTMSWDNGVATTQPRMNYTGTVGSGSGQTVDPTTMKFMRIVLNNTSTLTRVRLKVTDAGANNNNINAHTISVNDTPGVFTAYDFDLTSEAAWTSATSFGIQFRVIDPAPLSQTSNIAIDQIIFSSSLLSAEDNRLQGVNIFATGDRLTVISPVEQTEVNLYNLLGSRVKSISKTNKRLEIPVSDLAAGVYVVKLKSKEKTFTQKVVIQ
ncbi:T9SS type A sorting domain-containing protein [Flavivirga amylovorans]|uniref:T9SS type A sorting domain-containing protein n=1 Tax=Flavivirga amylovorans TaxID=870486 RepID=A0ABT8WX19_9FLAO|nr:T9SS type A sorting domain-containing protein [Flavivirga amylovorans]MDO5986223.1 T9SS type A sorting domain-containing protein [Flavivirga amylovorans]